MNVPRPRFEPGQRVRITTDLALLNRIGITPGAAGYFQVAGRLTTVKTVQLIRPVKGSEVVEIWYRLEHGEGFTYLEETLIEAAAPEEGRL